MKLHPIETTFSTQLISTNVSSPTQGSKNYANSLSKFKQYTNNINTRLQRAFIDQNKAVFRKKRQLQNELFYLKEQFEKESKKIRQMEKYFLENCYLILKSDISKWQNHQDFYSEMLEKYQQSIQTQYQINAIKKEQINKMKSKIKQSKKDNIKSVVALRLKQKFPDKAKLPISSPVKMKKSKTEPKRLKTLKTQLTEITRPTERIITDRLATKAKTIKTEYECQLLKQEKDSQDLQVYALQMRKQDKDNVIVNRKRSSSNNLDSQKSRKNNRVKTQHQQNQINLPLLKKDESKQNSRLKKQAQRHNTQPVVEYNFMKPTKVNRKIYQNQESIIPEMIKLFRWSQAQNQKRENSEQHWFQKIVYNNRNLEKIIQFLTESLQIRKRSLRKRSKSANKIKQVVAKNFFRLKTQSAIQKNLKKDKSLSSFMTSVINFRGH